MSSDAASARLSPVGFFDSGVGGLSVRDAFARTSPGESTIYLADTANCPYGNLPPDRIASLSRRNAEFLLSSGCKAVVVACNTATAAAIDSLRSTWPDVPFIGMEPAIKPAALQSKSGVVGVMATAGTFGGRLYRETKRRYASSTVVMAVVADELVGIAESMAHFAGGRFSMDDEDSMPPRLAERASESARRLVEPLLAAGADRIVLGCTHFLHLRKTIARVAAGRAEIVDPADAVARQTAAVLARAGLSAPTGARTAHRMFSNRKQGGVVEYALRDQGLRF